MIKVQLKHAEFSNSLINDGCNAYLNTVLQDANLDLPDRYWAMTNADQQLFTYGTKIQHDSSQLPALINGLPLKPQHRGGGITYHGPGQLTWAWIIDWRRLARLQPHPRMLDINRVLEFLAQVINARFGENLRGNINDPGLFRPSGEKILSFGTDVQNLRWLTMKLSLNLCTDLAVYNNATICGKENRNMGNLLTELPDMNTQIQLSQDLVRDFWAVLYDEYQEVACTD